EGEDPQEDHSQHDRNPDAVKRSLTPQSEGEGERDKSHDQRDDRKRDLVLELDLELRDRLAALLKLLDVVLELTVTHLVGRPDLGVEVVGGLEVRLDHGLLEALIGGHLDAVEAADPAVVEQPAAADVSRVVGVKPPGQPVTSVEVEDLKPLETRLLLVVVQIVVDVPSLAEQPLAVRPPVGSRRRLAPDLVLEL